MRTNKGFAPFEPALLEWIQMFPTKGYIALAIAPDAALIKLAIKHQLINSTAPYKLTRRGRALKG